VRRREGKKRKGREGGGDSRLMKLDHFWAKRKEMRERKKEKKKGTEAMLHMQHLDIASGKEGRKKEKGERKMCFGSTSKTISL